MNAMCSTLPSEVVMGATLRDNEYGWTLSAFPAALTAAERFGFACLGGQLQFRLESSICEAYWLNADSSERLAGEDWCDYVHRSCKEVKTKFTELVSSFDVQQLVGEWPTLVTLLAGIDPETTLFFIAYFVTETEYLAL